MLSFSAVNAVENTTFSDDFNNLSSNEINHIEEFNILSTENVESLAYDNISGDLENANAEIVLSPSRIYVGDSAYVSLKLPVDAKGSLNVYELFIDYDEFSQTYGAKFDLVESKPLVDGFANVTLSGLGFGEHYIYANYSGMDYNVSFDNITDLDSTISRGEYVTSVIVDPCIKYPNVMNYGANEIFSIDFGKNLSGNLTYSYSNKNYSINIINGKGTFSLSKLDIGTNNIYIHVDVGYKFSKFVYIKIKPNAPKLIGKNISLYYYDGTSYSVKVYGIYGKLVTKGEKVTFKIGGKTFIRYTNSKGVASLKIIELPKKFTIVTKYKDVTIKNTINVKKILVLYSIKIKKSAKKIVLKAKLSKKLKGKTIKFNFNGHNFKAKTNKQGIAKVTIKKSLFNRLKVGKKVTYKATYVKQTIKKSAKVKR